MDRDEDDDRDIKIDRASKNSWAGKKGSEYIERTKNNPPSEELKDFIKEINLKQGKAIELGPGAGANTVFLLENGWNVTSIDVNKDSETTINSLINDDERIRFSFKKCDFNDLKLKDKYDLIIAFNSIYFCKDVEKFFEMLNKAIKPGGYFIGDLLGEKHYWKECGFGNEMEFFSKDAIIKLFRDRGFDIQKEKEEEKEIKKLGEIKHWHSFLVVAKKIKNIQE